MVKHLSKLAVGRAKKGEEVQINVYLRKVTLHSCYHASLQILFNNQPDALIIQNLFCYKTPQVSGNFFAHHQEFSTVHSALLSFMQVFVDRFQAESGWNAVYCFSEEVNSEV